MRLIKASCWPQKIKIPHRGGKPATYGDMTEVLKSELMDVNGSHGTCLHVIYPEQTEGYFLDLATGVSPELEKFLYALAEDTLVVKTLLEKDYTGTDVYRRTSNGFVLVLSSTVCKLNGFSLEVF